MLFTGFFYRRRAARSSATRVRTTPASTISPPFPSLAIGPAMASGLALPAEGVNLEDLERSLVVQALDRAGGNQTRAATLLGLNRDQIRYRIEKFGLGKSSPA